MNRSNVLIGTVPMIPYGTSYQYDLMGNITGLTRNGLQDDNSYGLIDNLSFDYNGNQLLKVTDAVTSGPNYSGAFHFNDHSNASIEYTYDANGNMTKDRNKYIMSVTYNTLNLPVDVLYEDNSYTYSTSFHYAGDGRPLRVNHSLKKIKPLFPFNGFSGLDDIQKVVFLGIIKPNPAEMYNGDEFCGSLTYHSGTISYMSVDGGYVTFNSGTPTYHFYIHDHLGNNRVVVNESGTVEQVNHYYPYGGLMGESTGGDIQKYKYNGKRLERNHGLDWYDYGARHYDAAIVSWPTMDPLAEKYYSISPYVYCHNNPILLNDIDGKEDNYWLLDNNENKNIKLYHDYFFQDDPNVINIWAHGIVNNGNGSAKGFTAYINGKEFIVRDVESFLEVMENSKLWKDNKGKNVTIVLHSCSTATFVEKLSKSDKIKNNNINIIAPTLSESVFPINVRVEQNFFEEILFGIKMKTTDFFHGVYEGVVKNANTESGKKLFVTKKGSWNMYRQGLLEKKYAWNSAPGSIGFTY